jgi:SOS-response transcriptional repressor LexA
VDILGFEMVVANNGNYFIKVNDNSMIEICVTKENVGRFGDKASGIGHIALKVEDFEGTVKKLFSARVEVVIEPK